MQKYCLICEDSLKADLNLVQQTEKLQFYKKKKPHLI